MLEYGKTLCKGLRASPQPPPRLAHMLLSSLLKPLQSFKRMCCFVHRLAKAPPFTVLVPCGAQRQKYVVLKDLLARTLALDGLLDRETYSFPVANVCRLHQQERCRFASFTETLGGT